MGKNVWLERGVSEADRYGRLLRYVWLDGDTTVNAVLVAEGYARGFEGSRIPKLFEARRLYYTHTSEFVVSRDKHCGVDGVDAVR